MSFDTSSRKKVADEENKQQLVESIETESQRLKTLLDQFYAQTHRTENHYSQINDSILESIDKLLAAGDWEGSLFLRNAAKPLKQAREEIIKLQQKMEDGGDLKHKKITLTDDMQIVFISIYQSEGQDLGKWERQLRSLSNYTQGRPVYVNEEEVVRAIRAKLMPGSEAYIKAVIKKKSILTTTRPMKDRLEQPILSLIDGAVEPDNILEFVHMGKRYSFVDGHLIPL
jgi:intracellular multiplication protein IcmQ